MQRAITRLAGMPWRRAIVAVAALLLVLMPATLAGALAAGGEADAVQADAAPTEADWTAIREVIGSQLAALRDGDGPRAFSFAAPGIQERFHDAPTFLRMVRESYAPLLDARYTEYLDGAVIAGDTIQPLRLVMRDDSVLIALYTVRRHGERWRVSGCVIAPSTLRSI